MPLTEKEQVVKALQTTGGDIPRARKICPGHSYHTFHKYGAEEGLVLKDVRFRSSQNRWKKPQEVAAIVEALRKNGLNISKTARELNAGFATIRYYGRKAGLLPTT